MAPVWEFTVRGTAVKVTRVAVAAGITVTPPPWDPNHAPVGISIESATGTVGGRNLTVTFTGAPKPGDQGCGADYTAEAVESSTAVVVIVTEHPHGLFEACTAVGAIRAADVELAAPLGERAVLEVKQGLPVPVRLTPWKSSGGWLAERRLRPRRVSGCPSVEVAGSRGYRPLAYPRAVSLSQSEPALLFWM